jgi:hypothetical protein
MRGMTKIAGSGSISHTDPHPNVMDPKKLNNFFRYVAYKLLYHSIHGRAKASQARRERTVLPNCVGELNVLLQSPWIFYF